LKENAVTYRDKIFKSTITSWIYYVVGVAFAFALIPLLIMEFKISQPLALIVGLLSFAAIYSYGVGRIKCGRCNFRFYYTYTWRVKYGAKNKKLNFCPHCGVNLDEHVQ
jgi:hypothetical protein